MMRLSLPADIAVKGVTYGTPRVGTPDFAKFFDEHVRLLCRLFDHSLLKTYTGY
jgi:hypothetical protein